jgi:hypothetical protein
MPQPKGYEPFCRIWTVNYKVIYQTGRDIPKGEYFSRPRSRLLLNADDANFFYAGLIAEQQVKVGYPAPGTVQTPFVEKFYNKKSFILAFVGEHIDFVSVATL